MNLQDPLGEGNGYLGNSVTAEEAELLRSLPTSEAQKLHRRIFERSAEQFPGITSRLQGEAEELLTAIRRGDEKPQGDPRLGGTDVTKAEEALNRLIEEAGF